MTMPANSRADFPREQPPQPNPIRLAHSKALAVAAQALPAEIVLAADTTVADGSQILGKPRHAAIISSRRVARGNFG